MLLYDTEHDLFVIAEVVIFFNAKTKLWSLEDRQARADLIDLIEVYKIIHGLSTVRFNTFFEFSHRERTRGHSLKLHKKRVMTDLRRERRDS